MLHPILGCGDCMEIMPKMPDKFCDLLLTDIPYGKVNRNSNGLRSLDKGDADIVTFDLREMMEQFFRLTKGSIYIFCSTEQVSEIRSIMIAHKLSTRLIVWEKTNPSPMNGTKIWLSGIECCMFGKFSGATFNGHCRNTVLRCPVTRSKIHPTQKPVKLIKDLIEMSSNSGDVVFDPFMGSGTTGVAAVELRRSFFGIEKNSEFYAAAEARIEEVCNGYTNRA